MLGAANLSFGMLLGWILADKERAEAGESAAMRVLGETRARAIKDGLARLAESSILDRYS